MIYLLLMFAGLLQAADYTVCATGCSYFSLQTALNSVSRGDTLTLKAGEVFEGSYRLPYKTGNGVVTLRSSRWRELPPTGTRVDETHAALMPKIQPSATNVAAIYAVPEEKSISSINTGTDVLTFSVNPGYSDGEPISFRLYSGGTLPLGITAGTTYYVRDVVGSTLKIALTPGGTAVDITGGITHTTVAQTQWVGSGYVFRGIEIRKRPGLDTLYNLVEIGRGEEYLRTGIPSNITFQHSYIHGYRDENGPNICLMLNGRNITVKDSRISECINPGAEGKAIAFWHAPGPMLIENNYLSAGSIHLLAGGSYVQVNGLVSGDEGDIVIKNNLFTRPFWMKYTAGTGGTSDPVGACSDGAYYLNVTSGAWFKCNGTSWAAGPTCATGEYYRRTDVTQNCASGACWSCNAGVFSSYSVLRSSSYFTKNLFEIKSAKNVIVEGNIFENNWINGDQSGVGIWIVSQVSQYNANSWVRGENIKFYRNVLRNSTQGIRTASEGPGAGFGVNNNRIHVKNLLAYNIGASSTYPSINSSDSRPLSFAGPCDDCTFENLTIVSGTTGGTGVYWDTGAFTRPRLADSILYANLYGLLRDGGSAISGFWGNGNVLNSVIVNNTGNQSNGSVGAFATNTKYISSGTTLFVGSGNYRLQSTSPYSASCSTGCDYTSTSGGDLGADVDIVETAVDGVEAGVPSLAKRTTVIPGSTKAIVSYTAPNHSACTVKLYTNINRTTLHGDTDIAGEQTDSRAGSISSGRRRQLVLGTNTALTANTNYWLNVTCGTSVAVVPITTKSAGSGTYTVFYRYSTSRTGEYSSNSDMSSPSAISSSSTHSIPVTSGNIVYYRPSGGSIQTIVAP